MDRVAGMLFALPLLASAATAEEDEARIEELLRAERAIAAAAPIPADAGESAPRTQPGHSGPAPVPAFAEDLAVDDAWFVSIEWHADGYVDEGNFVALAPATLLARAQRAATQAEGDALIRFAEAPTLDRAQHSVTWVEQTSDDNEDALDCHAVMLGRRARVQPHRHGNAAPGAVPSQRAPRGRAHELRRRIRLRRPLRAVRQVREIPARRSGHRRVEPAAPLSGAAPALSAAPPAPAARPAAASRASGSASDRPAAGPCRRGR